MADPQADRKRDAAILISARLLAVYRSVKANLLKRAASGVRADLLLDYWLDKVTAATDGAVKKVAADTARALSDNVNPSRMNAWLEESASGHAAGWQAALNKSLDAIDATADDFEEQVRDAADEMIANTPRDAENIANAAVEFASLEAARANSAATKTWHHRPGKESSRASHEAMDGETVSIDERFSNGQRFPGGPGKPSETMNCRCYMTFGGKS